MKGCKDSSAHNALQTNFQLQQEEEEEVQDLVMKLSCGRKQQDALDPNTHGSPFLQPCQEVGHG